MAKQKPTPKNFPTTGLWLILLCGSLVVGGLASYAKFGPANRVPADQMRASRGSAAVPRGQENPASAKEVTTVTPRYDGENLKFDKVKTSVPAGADAVVFAVNDFLLQSKLAPKQARLLSCKIDQGTAELDFNKAFETTYGTEDERTILTGILTAMGQFKSVERVLFLIEGKPLETLGNVDLTTPQKVVRDPQPEDRGSDAPALP